jgi:hypothetical protein
VRRRLLLPVLVLGLAACGGADQPRVQHVAFCPGTSTTGDPVQVEFRQGDEVVGAATLSTGTAVTVEVPVGVVDIYADGAQAGSVGLPDDADAPYASPGPADVTYLSRPGCPEAAPAWPDQAP